MRCGIAVYLDEEKLETVDLLKPGESKKISYTHIVTEEEIREGVFKTVASAALEEDKMYVPLNLMEDWYKCATNVELYLGCRSHAKTSGSSSSKV